MPDKNKDLFLEEEEDPPPSLRDLNIFLESSSHDDFFIENFSNDYLDDFKNEYSIFQTPNKQSTNLVPGVKVEIIRDLPQCEQLWRFFSPLESLFDTWEFRYAFYLAYKHSPYFILLKEKGEKLALLPLWYEADRKKYFWFGSWWQEDNSFFVKDLNYVPMLLDLALPPLHLNAIKASTIHKLREINNSIDFQADDPKYIVNLRNLKQADDFIANLKKKRRYNIKRDQKRINELKPKIIYNRFEDFDKLVELSKKRFCEKNESTDWEDPRRVEAFKQVIKLAKKKRTYQIRMISIEINKKIAAIDLIAIYKKNYYPLKCAYNVAEFPGIGNFTNLFEIEDALSLGMKKIDFLEMSYGWKDKWFESIPLYKLEKDK
ncbi:MAG: GNAT family N-acetyltransferase [Candidatus Woesebacteria bacterium]|jgi:hypothetical protein